MTTIKLDNNLFARGGWVIGEEKLDEAQIVTTGSNFMLGNGYLGYRGTFADSGKDQYAACIVADTYDMADGKWQELCNVPNGLYTKLYINGEDVLLTNGNIDQYERSIDLKNSLFHNQYRWQKQHQQVDINVERFASMSNIHLLAMRYTFSSENAAEITLFTGIDGDVWSINGEHFSNYTLLEDQQLQCDGAIAIETTTCELNTKINVVEGIKIAGAEPSNIETIKQNKQVLRKLTFQLDAKQSVTLEKYVCIYHSNDTEQPQRQAIADLEAAMNAGYATIKQQHITAWQAIWDASDIKIAGDNEAQVFLRFSLYHNIIATPTHDHLPIGARGLSCQAYQGAAFWDQEIFNMPMFLYTNPKLARNILEYRFHTLDGARQKAQKLGYEGAFYAWISGKTGEELCPSYFFKDVLTGRKIRNHFNDWQIHVSPDIAYAIWQYYEATEDWQFIAEYGAEIIFEVARFLFSHAYFKKTKDRYEFIRLLGPDEYHENVDNNAFTNYQAQYALEKACFIFDKLKDSKDNCAAIQAINLSEQEVDHWRDMANKIYLPQANESTQLIEQFDGYFQLEDVSPKEIHARLLDPGEYHGWPNGIAVETQVIKQADLIQLFCLQDKFPADVIKANYDYYEPRSEHGSSLSLSAYSMIASKVGYIDAAYQYFMKSCTVDLYNTNKAISGGTFIGGIHTAACGAAWQMMVIGFAGFKPTGNKLTFKPTLPEKWTQIEFNINYRKQSFNISINNTTLTVVADSNNSTTLDFEVAGKVHTVQAGQTQAFPI